MENNSVTVLWAVASTIKTTIPTILHKTQLFGKNGGIQAFDRSQHERPRL